MDRPCGRPPRTDPYVKPHGIVLLLLLFSVSMAGYAYDHGGFSTKAGKAWRKTEPLDDDSDYIFDPQTGFAIKHDPFAGR